MTISQEVAKYTTDDRVKLHKALDEWFDQLIDEQPDINDGESLVFRLEGGRVSSTDENMPLFSFMLETRKSVIL